MSVLQHRTVFFCYSLFHDAEGKWERMATEDFKTLQKVQDMMTYGYPILSRFPKVEKFSLAADIRTCMNELLELTITEEKRYTKKTTLENMDICNEKLKIYLRVAMELKYISFHTYEVWVSKLVEIGKMIGGLIKSVRDRSQT